MSNDNGLNMLHSSSAMTEVDCFKRLIDALENARHSANGLAQLRKDMRWYVIAKMLDAIKDKVSKLMVKPKGIVIPSRF